MRDVVLQDTRSIMTCETSQTQDDRGQCLAFRHTGVSMLITNTATNSTHSNTHPLKGLLLNSIKLLMFYLFIAYIQRATFQISILHILLLHCALKLKLIVGCVSSPLFTYLYGCIIWIKCLNSCRNLVKELLLHSAL